MTTFRVNTPYLQHSTPEYNAAHKKENSEYNAKYYQAHKEKWGVKKDENSKSGTDSDKDEDEKDKKKKKSGQSVEDILSKLNGGSKSVGKGSSKKSSSKKTSEKSSDEKKKNETEEEKQKREEEERAEEERKNEELRKKNAEYTEEVKKHLTAYSELVKQKQKKKTVKHSYSVSIDGELYLKHHGIDNQRWGVRHGPPYPLAREVANAVKKGAEKGLKEGRKNAINYAVQGTVRPVTDRIQKKKNPQKFDAKKLATGALVIAGSALATGIITKLVDYGIDKSVDAGKKAVATVLVNAPHEGLSNVGVNMLLDAARKARN